MIPCLSSRGLRSNSTRIHPSYSFLHPRQATGDFDLSSPDTGGRKTLYYHRLISRQSDSAPCVPLITGSSGRETINGRQLHVSTVRRGVRGIAGVRRRSAPPARRAPRPARPGPTGPAEGTTDHLRVPTTTPTCGTRSPRAARGRTCGTPPPLHAAGDARRRWEPSWSCPSSLSSPGSIARRARSLTDANRSGDDPGRGQHAAPGVQQVAVAPRCGCVQGRAAAPSGHHRSVPGLRPHGAGRESQWAR
jgi:hypothetical protein